MSAATTTHVPTRPSGARPDDAARAADARRGIPFLRLARVELRKQLDTRAGAWLLGVIVLVNAALITLMLTTAEPGALTWMGLTETASFGQIMLLPLIGIMAATSEWSQRTAVTTFVLEPRRSRVNGAKLLAAVVLGLGVMVATLAAAALLNVVGLVARDGDGAWTLDLALVGGTVLALAILVTQGVAFGLALLSTPGAIVAYLALPTAWTVLSALVEGLRGPSEWLDINMTMLPLMAGEMGDGDWARLAASVGVWVALPLAIGLWRTARREVA
ncbi:ABC transporter permease [Actinotalea sp. BY-33]|uniref:ABC transporter permease n=1 Tax=Actinotalea soli TaxID=2819234 RepID=A0A939LRN3_9CELL|nr:ABC transporter permease [Actinotalea soli]MBO1751395.1 ABC transporter permease [Actinotalea soli]